MGAKLKRQRPIKGGRWQIGAGVEPKIRQAVEREAKRYGCTMAYVLKVAAADALGVDLEDEDRYSVRPDSMRAVRRA